MEPQDEDIYLPRDVNPIRLVNRINDVELRWFYQNCELLIVPLTAEGFADGGGFVVRRPCRCSDVPTFREIGENACHYLDLHIIRQCAG